MNERIIIIKTLEDIEAPVDIAAIKDLSKVAEGIYRVQVIHQSETLIRDYRISKEEFDKISEMLKK